MTQTCGPALAVTAMCAIGLAACDLWPKSYAAEVGYYAGETIAWDVWGDFQSLEDCRNAAIARFNYYHTQNERAYSWACLMKNGKGGYASRHR